MAQEFGFSAEFSAGFDTLVRFVFKFFPFECYDVSA